LSQPDLEQFADLPQEAWARKAGSER
jgi:hypothetical protein